MTRMTLGTKLTAGFAAMLGLSSLLSLGALTALSSLRDRFDNAVNKTAKKIELAGDLDSTQSKMFMDQRGILLYAFLKDRARMDQFKDAFNKDAASMRELLRALRPLVSTEHGRQLSQSIEGDLDQWLSSYQRILELAYANQAEEAVAVSRDKVLPLNDAMSKAAKELVAVQKNLLAADKEAAAESYSLHRWITLAGLLLSLGLGAVVLLTVRGANRTLKLVASQISESSTQVSSAASQVASSSQSLAQGASQQAASLEQTSASTEEITSMTRKNAENSQAVAKLMVETESRVGGANQALDQMVASMTQIDASSDKVAKIIKTVFAI